MEAAPGFVDPVLPRVSVLVARGTFYLIAAILIVTLIWLSITKVNVVVRAEGKLTPRAEPLRLSISQGGIVAKVMVDVGAKVKAGQPILEIDAFREAADASQDQHELDQARSELQRYSENATRFEAATGHIREALDSEARVMKLVSSQVQELREGFDGGAVSLFEVQVKERDLAEAQSHTAQLNSDLSRSEADARQNRWLETQTAQKIKSLQVKLSRDVEVKQKTILSAPTAGVVTSVIALRPGGYVQPNDVAATIVPGDEPLLAEVWIPNDSMRRVRPSLPVRMKIKAYPYQQFGLLPGRLISVDPDADAAGTYRAWIKPDRLILNGAHGPELLRPGLALTSEIVVDQRTLLAVILDPIRRIGRGFALSQ